MLCFSNVVLFYRRLIVHSAAKCHFREMFYNQVKLLTFSSGEVCSMGFPGLLSVPALRPQERPAWSLPPSWELVFLPWEFVSSQLQWGASDLLRKWLHGIFSPDWPVAAKCGSTPDLFFLVEEGPCWRAETKKTIWYVFKSMNYSRLGYILHFCGCDCVIRKVAPSGCKWFFVNYDTNITAFVILCSIFMC